MQGTPGRGSLGDRWKRGKEIGVPCQESTAELEKCWGKGVGKSLGEVKCWLQTCGLLAVFNFPDLLVVRCGSCDLILANGVKI